MPLTPEDVSNKRFTAVRLREGYDMGEVDAFLDEVQAELVRLARENDELRTKLETAQAGGQVGDQAPAAAAAPAAAPAETTTDGAAPAGPAPATTATSPAQLGVETLRVTTTAEASTAAARLLELTTR